MPSDHPCPPADEYQQLLSGIAPPDQVEALASHLNTCPNCANTIQTLLNQDTLGDSIRSAADLPALGQVPSAVLSKLLALAASKPSGPDLEAPTITREPSGPLPSRSAEGATDGSWAEPRVVAEDTLFTPSAMGAPQKPGEVGTFAGYRVIAALGQGGMGVVYLAEDVQLQRRVALKVMKPDLAASDSARQRFLAEARAAARIRSDYVVTIYQTAEHGGAVFAAMELLHGATLDGWMKTHRDAPVAELVRIGRETALGLAAAHDEGLIHRDIKPGNIWVETSGRVKLLDFGLARRAEGGVDLTKSGAVIGTPAYMAPEQARGERVDHRADLFALGCVLYRLTTGQMPFKGDTVMGVLTALAVDHPSPAHAVNPAVPPRLSALIARLLAKNPADRPQSARAVADELQAIRTEMTAPTVVPMAQPVLIPESSDFDFDARTEVSEPARAPKRAKARAAAPRAESDAAPARRSRRPLILAGVAFALLALGAVATAMLIFTTADGTLIVEVDDTADVRFRKGKLEIYDESGSLKYTLEPSEKNRTLPPGKYLVKVVGADGVKLETESFELQRKGQAYVRVKAVPGAGAVAVGDPKKPDPTPPVVPGKSDGMALHLFFGGLGAEAPAPALDTQRPWTAEAYLTPLTDNVAKNVCRVVGCEGGFGLGVRDGTYSVYSHHGETTAGVVRTGQRVHLACVQTESKRLMFLNGKLVGSTDNPLPQVKQAPGKLVFSLVNGVEGTPPIDVFVDGVRLSQTVRYTKDFTPPGRHTPDKETLALYHCDEGQGDKLTDSSGNNLHAKLVNAKWGKVPTPSSLPPDAPGTPLALKPGTWKPGPADNALPGLVARPALLDGVGRWQIVPTAALVGVVSFSPDGKWVATADDTVLRLYDAQSGALTNLFLLNKGQPIGQATTVISWSADSRWLKWGNNRGNSTVADGNTFAAVDGSLPVAKFETSSNADYGWNPKHNVAAWVPHSTFDRIEIVDPTQAKPIEIAVKVGGQGKAVWSPDGETLLVVREDKTAQLFGRDGKPGAKLTGEVDPVASPAWSADAKQIAAMASPNEVGFWKADGTLAAKTGKHEKPPAGLHWRPDGKLLAVSDAEGKRHFWKPDGTSEWVADTKDGTPGFEWAKDGKGFFTPGKFWPAVGNPSFTATQPPGYWPALVSPDQKSAALMKPGELMVAELQGGEAKDVGWKLPVGGELRWAADGTRLAVANARGVSLYDARDPKKVVWLGGGQPVGGLNRAAFSPKGDRLAVAGQFGPVTVCEPTGKVLRALAVPTLDVPVWAAPGTVHDVRWHPDGRFLAVTTGICTVLVFDTETGNVEAMASVTANRPGGSALFSPANPDHLLIAHPDGAALWRWKVEKEPLQKFPGLGRLVPGPDGKRLLALPAAGGIHGNEPVPAALLSPDLKDRDTAGTKEYVPQQNHPGPSLAWHPDGKHLVVTRLGEARSIQIRSLDGKVVEEIKPEGIDVTWLEWVEPVARRNVLVGRTGQGPDTYLFDLGTKKLTSLGKVSGELVLSPDGKHLIALEGSTLTYRNLDTKAIDQKVVLLPDGGFVALSAAGEVLDRSANAEAFYRYIVEDRSGKLAVKTPAEMAPSLPKSNAAPPAGWTPTPDQLAYIEAVAALPVPQQIESVIRKMREVNPVIGENPPVEVVFEPKDGPPTFCKVAGGIAYDAWPLAALPSLTKIDLSGTSVIDFRPLSRLPLQEIQLKIILDNVASEEALKAVPTLKTINGTPAKEFWTTREAIRQEIDKMAAVAKTLSPEDQTTWVRKTMKKLHPILDDGVFNAITVNKVEGGLLQFRAYDLHGGVYDFSPVRALPIEGFFQLDGNLFDATPLGKCTQLKVIQFNRGNAVRDLTPLKGLQLTELSTAASDLRPLQGMPLKKLSFGGTRESDLSPLQGMPLEELYVGGAKDLRPLAGMKLKRLVSGHYSPISDLSPLKGMPLEALILHRPQVTDFSPLAGMPLKEFDVLDPLVADFSPLKGMPFINLMLNRGIVDPVLATMPLKSLSLRFRLYSESEEKVLRSLKLESINGMKPDDFWKDAEKRRKEDADKTAEMAKVPLEAAALEKALWVCGQFPKVKIENGVVVEIAAGHANGGLDNPFAVLLAFSKVRKLTLESGGDYSALSKLTELEEFNCPPLEVAFNRLTLQQLPKLKTINGKPAKDVLDGK